MLKPYIAKIMRRESLTAEEAEQAMQIIMSGQATAMRRSAVTWWRCG
jgi:anthranilate phosphoribosyltransferase